MRLASRLLALGLIMSAAVLIPLDVRAQGPFADPAFAEIWARTDGPVSAGEASRTYYWGPCTSTPDGLTEPLSGAPGNARLVQYFDKSRMELNDPRGDRADPWFVTNGLLANELITGRIQVGYATFEARTPSAQAVAGDPGDLLAPSYLALGRILGLPPRDEGTVITETIDHDGNRGANPSLSRYGVTATDLIPATQHRLASVFRDFLLSSGPVREGGQLITAPLSDPPFFVTGLPTSEAYWARAAIGGVIRDVLVQVFERRVLTYVPTNEPAFRVEMANIGLHYRAWRYGTSLDYFGALPGNRWTYADSRTGGTVAYQVVGLDSAFKPGQTLLRVVVAAAVPTTEYWQERDGQLLIHGRTEPNGATVRYEPPYIAARYCLAVGQRWETTTTRAAGPSSRPQVVRFSYTVEGTDTVVTPSGTCPSFRIRREDTDTPDGGVRVTTLWFSPYVGLTRERTPQTTIELRGTELH
jgi:hypothetical protein